MANQQNPYAVAPVPQFEQAIDPSQVQQYKSTGPKTVSGVGGKTEGIAFIADKFFEGVSRGRAQKFIQGQQERQQLISQVNSAYDRIDKSDLVPEEKAKLRGQLDAMNLLQMKQDVDQSPEKGHPHVKALRGLFDSIVGPGAKKYEFGPEQIYKTLSNVYSQVGDQSNTVQSRLGQISNNFSQVYNALSEQRGHKLTADEIAQTPVLSNLMTSANQLSGGKGLPAGMENIIGEAQTKQKQEYSLEQERTKVSGTNAYLKQERAEALYRQKHNLDPNTALSAAESAQAEKDYSVKAAPRIEYAVINGKPVGVIVDLNNPGVVRSADTGETIKLKEGDLTSAGQLSAQDRAKYWGEFGNFLRAFEHQTNPATGKKFTEEEAMAQAGRSVLAKTGVQLGVQEQRMAANAFNSGIMPSMPEGFLPQGFDIHKAADAIEQGKPIPGTAGANQAAAAPAAKSSAPPTAAGLPSRTATIPGINPAAVEPGKQAAVAQTKQPPIFAAPSLSKPKGLLAAGNIDLTKRPIVKNPDGSTSTVRSMSFEEDGKEVLVPTVSDDGRILSDDEAIANYKKTGKHLGKFDNPSDATAYAKKLHDDYANGKIPGYPAVSGAAQKQAASASQPPPVKKSNPNRLDVAQIQEPKVKFNDQQYKFIDLYLGQLMGTSPRGGDSFTRAGVTKGQELLASEARKAGIDPMDLVASAVMAKEQSKAIGQTIERVVGLKRATDVMEQLAPRLKENLAKIPQAIAPYLNKPLRDIDLGLVGDPDLRRFLVDLNDFARQYTVVTAGGTLSRAQLPVSTASEVDRIINGNGTVKEVQDTVEEVQELARRELTGMQNTINDTKKAMQAGALGQAAGNTPATTQQPPAAGGMTLDEFKKKHNFK